MFVVAITRWGPPLEQELAALAPLLGLALYDAKMRLAGPTPVVFARVDAAERARELLATLRQRGHGAVACGMEAVPSSASMATPRDYQLTPTELVTTQAAQPPQALPYVEILALIRAGASATSAQTQTTTKKEFSLVRAAVTQGMIRHKTTTKTSTTKSEQREQVLYVIRNSGRDPLLLRESVVRHDGLGAARQATRLLNFVALVDTLRSRAPDALYDERLLKQRRKASTLGMPAGAGRAAITSSNASENDLAAHLLAIAHLKGQL